MGRNKIEKMGARTNEATRVRGFHIEAHMAKKRSVEMTVRRAMTESMRAPSAADSALDTQSFLR
jgi:hypothetical protein